MSSSFYIHVCFSIRFRPDAFSVINTVFIAMDGLRCQTEPDTVAGTGQFHFIFFSASPMRKIPAAPNDFAPCKNLRHRAGTKVRGASVFKREAVALFKSKPAISGQSVRYGYFKPPVLCHPFFHMQSPLSDFLFYSFRGALSRRLNGRLFFIQIQKNPLSQVDGYDRMNLEKSDFRGVFYGGFQNRRGPSLLDKRCRR